MAIPAVGYVRCSTDMQAETSPVQQRELITEWAGKHGYQILDWYQDIGASGTSFERRPEFRRLLSVVESKPPFRAVIVLDETRWGRAGAEESIYYKRHFKKLAKVDVLSVRTNANTGNEMMDSISNVMEGTFSRQESVRKSERTLDGCQSAIRQGHSAGGTAPYGFRRVAVHRFSGERRALGFVHGPKGEVMRNAKDIPLTEQIRPKEEYTVWELGEEEEVKVVRQIYRWRVEQGFGYTKIAKLLNSKEVKCPARGKWSNKDQKWSGATVGTIVRNPAYRGAQVYDRLKKESIGRFSRRFWVRDESKWIFNENAHPAIVSAEVWAKANPAREASDNGRMARKRFDSPYLLSGLIKCPHCGFNYSGKAQFSGSPGKRTRRRTYVDSGYTNKGPSVCSFMSIDADRLEKSVLGEIARSLQMDEVTRNVGRLASAFMKSQGNAPSNDIEKIDKEIEDVVGRIKKLVRLAEECEEAGDRIRELKEEQKRLERKKGTYKDVEVKPIDSKAVIQSVREFMGNLEENLNNATPAEKKALVAKFVPRINVDQKKRIATCYVSRLPKGVSPAVDELIEREVTYLLSVPPTRFELVLQA